MIWSINTPDDTYSLLKDVCHVSHVFWNGFKLLDVQDKRIVETTVCDWMKEDTGIAVFAYVLNNLAGTFSTLYVDDFRRPVLSSLLPPSSMVNLDPIKAALPAYNFNKLQVGLNGPYQTRALPVFSGSGVDWHVSLTPRYDFSGTNQFLPSPPLFRYKRVGGWSTWAAMTAVPGIKNTYKVVASGPPMAVQVQLEPWHDSSMAIFG